MEYYYQEDQESFVRIPIKLIMIPVPILAS